MRRSVEAGPGVALPNLGVTTLGKFLGKPPNADGGSSEGPRIDARRVSKTTAFFVPGLVMLYVVFGSRSHFTVLFFPLRSPSSFYLSICHLSPLSHTTLAPCHPNLRRPCRGLCFFSVFSSLFSTFETFFFLSCFPTFAFDRCAFLERLVWYFYIVSFSMVSRSYVCLFSLLFLFGWHSLYTDSIL